MGIAAALAAVAFILTLHKAEDIFAELPLPDWIKPALGGLLLGCIILQWPEAFGVGYGSMNNALHNRMGGMMLLALVFVKIIATSATLGSGGSGGIFAPSLFIGAMCGGFFGWLVGTLFPGIAAPPGAYALVGMGAVVAGTTHAPITAILIIFEMTGDYKIILPMMITCIIATITATILHRDSIYTGKLRRKGIDIAGGLEQNILRSLKVVRFMTSKSVTVPESMPLVEIIRTFKHENVPYLHVVDSSDRLLGIISFRDIRQLLREEGLHYLVIAGDVCTRSPVTVAPDDDIQKAMHLMSARGISQLPVVEQEAGGRVIGALRQKDVLAAYDKAVIQREIEGD